MQKRMIILLLAIVLAASLLPMAAAAVEISGSISGIMEPYTIAAGSAEAFGEVTYRNAGDTPVELLVDAASGNAAVSSGSGTLAVTGSPELEAGSHAYKVYGLDADTETTLLINGTEPIELLHGSVYAAEGSMLKVGGKTVTGPARVTVSAIVVEERSGGTVTVPAFAMAGDTVTFTLSPDQHYEPTDLYVSGFQEIQTVQVDESTYTFTMPEGNVYITVQWGLQRHTVTYLDGETVLGTDHVQHGSIATGIPLVPQREGYNFVGWYSDAECTQQYEFGTPVTSDLNLYLGREPISYYIWVCGTEVNYANAADVLGDGTVSYDPATTTLTLHDASLNTVGNAIMADFQEQSTLTVHGVGSSTISASCLITEGVDEEGYSWTEREGGCGIYVQSNGELILTGTLGDITAEDSAIYAVNGVTIDGTVGDIAAGGDAIGASFGDVVISGSVGDVVTAGEDFTGGDGIYGSSVVISGSVGDISAKGRGIVGAGGDVSISGTVGNITGGSGHTGSGGMEAYGEYDWSPEDGEILISGGSVVISGTVGSITGDSVGIYTEENLSIDQGCTVEIEAVDADYGAAINVGGYIARDCVVVTLPLYAQLGAIFGGDGEEGSTTICDSEGNVALHIRFEPGFTVSYWAGDSEDYIPERNYPSGSTVVRPDDPTLEGHIFGGWYVDEELSIPFDFTGIPEDGDYLLLYAKWTPAPPPGPGAPTLPAPAAPSEERVTVPVSGDGSTVRVEVRVDGSTATLEQPDPEALGSVTGDAAAAGTVTVDFSGLDTAAPITAVEIPAAVLKELAEAVSGPSGDGGSFKVILSDGISVEFDAAALAARADGPDITVSVVPSGHASLTAAQKKAVGDRPAYDVRVSVGGEAVSELGGTITLSLPYELAEGEAPERIEVWYVAESGRRVCCETRYDSAEQRVSWKTDHLSLYMIDHCPGASFADLDMNQWYHEAIDYVLANSLMNGVGEDSFQPGGSTTRAMIVTILWRLEGEPVSDGPLPFADVPADTWYTQAVRWAAREELVLGWEGQFDPMGEITREQFAAILWRYARYRGCDVSVGENTNILSYADAFSVSEYAIPAMQWACGAGLMQGDGEHLSPGSAASRAQAAALLMRFAEFAAK